MKRRKWLFIQCLFLLLLALAIACMPFTADNKVVLYLCGALFWLGLLGTVAMALLINKSRRASQRFKSAYPNRKQLGLTHFFRNRPAAAADIVLFVSAIALAVVRWFFRDAAHVQFILLAVLVFSFGMHCILNGLNYIYLTNPTKRRKGA